MVFTKKVAKAPAVMVETKKLSAKDTCCTGAPILRKIKHLLMFILIVLNTVLLICVFLQQTKIEADRVGGEMNYKMVQQIYKSPTFKSQQAQQIQQALQLYQQGGTQQAAQVGTTTTTQPEVVQPTPAQ
jgi:hypothetical protein